MFVAGVKFFRTPGKLLIYRKNLKRHICANYAHKKH